MRPFAARLGAVLIGMIGAGLAGALPATAAQGFTTELTGLPEALTAGDRATRMSAVVSGSAGGDCQKVRWSLLVRAEGLLLSQVRIDRIEETGPFPVQVRTEGNSARITDRQLDPGTLCDDRTVTAQYDVAIAEDVTDGRIILAAEAYDVNLNLLSRRTIERRVVSERSQRDPADRGERTPQETGPVESEPARDPEVDAGADVAGDADVAGEDTPGEDAATGGAGPAGAGGGGVGPADAAARANGGTGLVQAGFVIGAVMLFLGVGLLVRLRTRLLDGEDEPRPAFAGSRATRVPRTAARRRHPVRY